MSVRRVLRKKIACEEAILDDSSVISRQWIILPHKYSAPLTPALLVERYLAFVRQCTLSVVQPVISGKTTAFSLFGSSFVLLAFAGPEFTGDSHVQTASLRIDGGLLLQRNECGKGMLSFTLEIMEEGVRVIVQVSDYCPLLLGSRKPSKIRKWFYRCTQAAVHKIITVRFLAYLYRELDIMVAS